MISVDEDAVLPSEVSRLILGFLETYEIRHTYNAFLEESPFLADCRAQLKRGVAVRTTMVNMTLQQILEDYIAIRRLILERSNFIQHRGPSKDLLVSLLGAPSGNRRARASNCRTKMPTVVVRPYLVPSSVIMQPYMSTVNMFDSSQLSVQPPSQSIDLFSTSFEMDSKMGQVQCPRLSSHVSIQEIMTPSIHSSSTSNNVVMTTTSSTDPFHFNTSSQTVQTSTHSKSLNSDRPSTSQLCLQPTNPNSALKDDPDPDLGSVIPQSLDSTQKLLNFLNSHDQVEESAESCGQTDKKDHLMNISDNNLPDYIDIELSSSGTALSNRNSPRKQRKNNQPRRNTVATFGDELSVNRMYESMMQHPERLAATITNKIYHNNQQTTCSPSPPVEETKNDWDLLIKSIAESDDFIESLFTAEPENAPESHPVEKSEPIDVCSVTTTDTSAAAERRRNDSSIIDLETSWSAERWLEEQDNLIIDVECDSEDPYDRIVRDCEDREAKRLSTTHGADSYSTCRRLQPYQRSSARCRPHTNQLRIPDSEVTPDTSVDSLGDVSLSEVEKETTLSCDAQFSPEQNSLSIVTPKSECVGDDNQQSQEQYRVKAEVLDSCETQYSSACPIVPASDITRDSGKNSPLLNSCGPLENSAPQISSTEVDEKVTSLIDLNTTKSIPDSSRESRTLIRHETVVPAMKTESDPSILESNPPMSRDNLSFHPDDTERDEDNNSDQVDKGTESLTDQSNKQSSDLSSVQPATTVIVNMNYQADVSQVGNPTVNHICTERKSISPVMKRVSRGLFESIRNDMKCYSSFQSDKSNYSLTDSCFIDKSNVSFEQSTNNSMEVNSPNHSEPRPSSSIGMKQGPLRPNCIIFPLPISLSHCERKFFSHSSSASSVSTGVHSPRPNESSPHHQHPHKQSDSPCLNESSPHHQHPHKQSDSPCPKESHSAPPKGQSSTVKKRKRVKSIIDSPHLKVTQSRVAPDKTADSESQKTRRLIALEETIEAVVRDYCRTGSPLKSPVTRKSSPKKQSGKFLTGLRLRFNSASKSKLSGCAKEKIVENEIEVKPANIDCQEGSGDDTLPMTGEECFVSDQSEVVPVHSQSCDPLLKESEKILSTGPNILDTIKASPNTSPIKISKSPPKPAVPVLIAPKPPLFDSALTTADIVFCSQKSRFSCTPSQQPLLSYTSIQSQLSTPCHSTPLKDAFINSSNQEKNIEDHFTKIYPSPEFKKPIGLASPAVFVSDIHLSDDKKDELEAKFGNLLSILEENFLEKSPTASGSITASCSEPQATFKQPIMKKSGSVAGKDIKRCMELMTAEDSYTSLDSSVNEEGDTSSSDDLIIKEVTYPPTQPVRIQPRPPPPSHPRKRKRFDMVDLDMSIDSSSQCSTPRKPTTSSTVSHQPVFLAQPVSISVQPAPTQQQSSSTFTQENNSVRLHQNLFGNTSFDLSDTEQIPPSNETRPKRPRRSMNIDIKSVLSVVHGLKEEKK